MKHTACQHTDEGEDACEACEYFGIIPKCTPSTLPSFNNFISSISRLKIKDSATDALVNEVLVGLGLRTSTPIQNAV